MSVNYNALSTKLNKNKHDKEILRKRLQNQKVKVKEKDKEKEKQEANIDSHSCVTNKQITKNKINERSNDKF